MTLEYYKLNFWLSCPKFHMLEHNIQCDNVNRWGCWHEGSTLTNTISHFATEIQRTTLSLCHVEMMRDSIFEAAHKYLLDIRSAGTSILGFLKFRYYKHYISILYKLHSLWYFVVGDQMHRDTEFERDSIISLNGSWGEKISKDKQHSFISPSTYRIYKLRQRVSINDNLLEK